MQPATEATLERLAQAAWFSRVGVRDTNGADVLTSWDEAMQWCTSPQWRSLCLEAANRYRELLLSKSPNSFKTWNTVVVEIRPFAAQIVEEKTRDVVKENNLPKRFSDAVRWDIIHLCMEAEFSAVCPPGFFAAQAYWYVQGHFPCGWIGDFPEGRLVIY